MACSARLKYLNDRQQSAKYHCQLTSRLHGQHTQPHSQVSFNMFIIPATVDAKIASVTLHQVRPFTRRAPARPSLPELSPSPSLDDVIDPQLTDFVKC